LPAKGAPNKGALFFCGFFQKQWKIPLLCDKINKNEGIAGRTEKLGQTAPQKRKSP